MRIIIIIIIINNKFITMMYIKNVSEFNSLKLKYELFYYNAWVITTNDIMEILGSTVERSQCFATIRPLIS